MKEYKYPFGGKCITTFVQQDDKVWLKEFFGLTCGFCGDDGGPAEGRGLFLLDTSLGRFESDDLKLKQADFHKDQVRLVWQTGEGKLEIQSLWSFDESTGIFSRKDALKNLTNQDVTVFKALARFPFTSGHYELYSQASRWCNENQGHWQDLDHGRLVLCNEMARTCQGGTPYLFLRRKDLSSGIVFHIIPCGDWEIRINTQLLGMDQLPLAIVETGLKTENLKMKLAAKASISLPEILIQGVPENDPLPAAPRLHRYLLKNYFQSAKPSVPVVYNTWFDNFDLLHIDRMRQQLAAAKEIGCEIFVIDAGWFGPEKGDWYAQTGDWREKTDGAFFGKMKEFSEEVRSAGLGFGIWMEPERACFGVPMVKQHPDWFVRGPSSCYPNLMKKEAYDYILSEISRLVEQYHLSWMKIDFNNHLGIDPSGLEFWGYYQGWYHLLDELKAKYPHMFFEACASGGMRTDINTLMHHDAHFLSDTVDPIDVLRISQGAALRLVPGRISKWVALRSVGQTIPKYPAKLDSLPTSVVSAGGPIWEPSWTVDPDFAIRVCLMGIMGFTGDVANLPPEAKDRLRFHVAYFKQWREFILSSICHLLSPIRPKEDRTGWVAFQLQNPKDTTSLIFAYRLDDLNPKYKLILHGLDPDRSYSIRNIDRKESEARRGSELMTEGFVVELNVKFLASVIEIIPV